MGGITSMEDLILILVLSGIGLVTLLVSVWLFYRKKRKTTEKKRACTAECRAAIVDAVNYHVKSKYRLAKAAGAVSVAHLLSGAGGSVWKMASLGVKTATLGLYYYPVYRYTYRGETYEQIGDVPAMEEQARKKVGTELTLFIDPVKPTSFYCLAQSAARCPPRSAPPAGRAPAPRRPPAPWRRSFCPMYNEERQ